MCPLLPPVNGSNQAADGFLKVTVAVTSSTTSMLSITSQMPKETAALDSVTIHSQVNWTSRAVNGSPSLQSTSGSSEKVALERSSASRPFSTDGTAVMRFGSSEPSSAYRMS